MTEAKRPVQANSKVYNGILTAFDGAYPSGQGFLLVDEKPIPCHISQTGQTLIKFFGSTSTEKLLGKPIIYALNPEGFLTWFAPAEGKIV